MTICHTLADPTLAAAQVTLVVRAGGEPVRAMEVVLDDTLRDVLGGSVRRLDPSLDELALAAGCTAAAADAPCVATVARAASARAVALASVSRTVDEWRVTLDLRRADGTRLRQLSVRCADATECREALASAFHDGLPAAPADTVPVVAALPPRARPAGSAARTAPLRAAPEPALEPDAPLAATATVNTAPVVPLVLFAGASLASVGAAVGGGLALRFAGDAAALGVVRSEHDVNADRALADASAVALGVGIAFALAGAGLAVAGVVTFAGGNHAHVRAVASATGATAAIAFDF